jgi:hypothetical protein
MTVSSLSKSDMVALLEKAQELIDTVIQSLPDNEEDNDDFDLSPSDYLLNAAGDIQDAINLID